MSLPPLTPDQVAWYGDDRRPAIYSSLFVLLAVNNIFVVLRCAGRYRTKRAGQQRLAVEDPLVVLSALLVDAIIVNLFAATNYGLGLHNWRVLHDDPDYPSNLSNIFKHVWITMVLMAPVFGCIKLTLLFFYRRLFLINQRWFRIVWWANIAYVAMWVAGSTGFYLFQCWRPQWYFEQYFAKYGQLAPGTPVGQCDATSVNHVSIPLILGLLQDFAILLLPVVTLWRLQLLTKRRLGLTGVFAIGILACVLDLARIVQLRYATDDKTDPSYGVAIFCILSTAAEVAAMVCICLPIIIPWFWQEYRRVVGSTAWDPYEYPSHTATAAWSRTTPPATPTSPPHGAHSRPLIVPYDGTKLSTDQSEGNIALQTLSTTCSPYRYRDQTQQDVVSYAPTAKVVQQNDQGI